MYNVKVFSYVGGQQFKLYKVPIHNGRTRTIDKKEPPVEEIEQIELDLIKQEVKTSDKYLDSLKKQKEKTEKSVYNSTTRSKNKIYSIARSNTWDYFITLTFNKDKVNRYDYESCCNKLKNWLDRYRRECLDLHYLIVPEQHKDGAWHFHGLISGGDYSSFVDSGKKDKKNVIYNIDNYKLGFTTATRIRDTLKASSYICKYITKDCYKNIPTGKKRYWYSKNIQILEFSIMATVEQIETYKKNPDLTYVSKVKNEWNEIHYLEFNYEERKKVHEQAYNYAVSLFGSDIVEKK